MSRFHVKFERPGVIRPGDEVGGALMWGSIRYQGPLDDWMYWHYFLDERPVAPAELVARKIAASQPPSTQNHYETGFRVHEDCPNGTVITLMFGTDGKHRFLPNLPEQIKGTHMARYVVKNMAVVPPQPDDALLRVQNAFREVIREEMPGIIEAALDRGWGGTVK